MDLMRILVILAHVIVAGIACNITIVQKCFVNLSEDLGLDSKKLQGSELMGFINPSTLHNDQVKLCSGLDKYNFVPLRQCVRNTQCANEPLLQDLDNVLPSLTWMTVVDMLEGICEPGCENLQSKNAAAEKCEMKTGTCSDLEESFRCYRDIIGSCEVLVAFTKSILQSMGVFDTVREHCPDVDYNLESASANTNYPTPALLPYLMNFIVIFLMAR